MSTPYVNAVNGTIRDAAAFDDYINDPSKYTDKNGLEHESVPHFLPRKDAEIDAALGDFIEAKDTAVQAAMDALDYRNDIADLAGISRIFADDVELNAAAAGLAENAVVKVRVDSTKSGNETYYKKEMGALVFKGYANPISADHIDSLLALTGVRSGQTVQTKGSNAAFDGGEDAFVYDATSTAPVSSQILQPNSGFGRYRRRTKTYDLRKLRWQGGDLTGNVAAKLQNRLIWNALQDELAADTTAHKHIIVPGGLNDLGIVGNGAPRVLKVINRSHRMRIEGSGRDSELSTLRWDTEYDWVASQPDAHILTMIGAEDVDIENIRIDNEIFKTVYPRYTTTLAADALASANSIRVTDPSKFRTATGAFVANRQFLLTLNAGASQTRLRKVITSITDTNQLNFSGTLGFDVSAGNTVQLYFQEQMHGIYRGTQAVYGLAASVCRGITTRALELCGIRGDACYHLGSDASADSYYSDIFDDDLYAHDNDRSGMAYQRGGKNVRVRARRMHDISDSFFDTEFTGQTVGVDGFEIDGGVYERCGSYFAAIGSNQSGAPSKGIKIHNVDARKANGLQITNLDAFEIYNNRIRGMPGYVPLTMLQRLTNGKFQGNTWIGSDDDLNVGYLQDSATAGDQSGNLVFENDTFDGSAATTPHNISVVRFGQGVQTLKMSRIIAIGCGGALQSGVQVVSISGALAAGMVTDDILLQGITGKNVRNVVSLNTNLSTAVPLTRVTVRDITPVNAGYSLHLSCPAGTGIPFPELRFENLRRGTVDNLFNETGSRQTFASIGGGSHSRGSFILLVGTDPNGVVLADIGADLKVMNPVNTAVRFDKAAGNQTTTGWAPLGGWPGQASYTRPTLPAGATGASATLAIPGSKVGDHVALRDSSGVAQLEYKGVITAAGVCTFNAINNSAATINSQVVTLYGKAFPNTYP